MKRLSLAALAAVALAPSLSQAQGPYVQPQMNNPYQRPVFSPYLNLTRPGANPAQNYYGLVRPQIQATRSMQGFQQELQTFASGLNTANEEASALNGQMPNTGHRAMFWNYSTYFPSMTNTRQGGSLGGITSMPGRPGFGSVGGARAPRGGGGVGR